jgi:UDP-N-acetylglucosamine--N-acetylmuramyl-(pentapeptide) pyrophosphoryl-undecaprenol N-acetylglucosamine transferase
MSIKKKKILLVGGGTLGSVSPLLAIADKYLAEYLFVGTSFGPEKAVVEKAGLNFQAIYSGKLRRYFSWDNVIDLFKIKLAFWQSLKIIKNFQPDLVLTAGSFVAVPMVYAAKLKRIPVVVHQQDLTLGLANKLMLPLASKITVTFPQQVDFFKIKKILSSLVIQLEN